MHTRREFLGTTATGLAAIASVPGLAAAQPPGADRPKPKLSDPLPPPAPVRKLRKAVMIGMAAEGATLGDKFKMIRDAGFEGVEMDSPTDLKTDAVLKARDDSGLVIHGVVDSVHWKFYLNAPDAAARAEGLKGLQTAIRDAAAWGAGSVLLVPGVVRAEMPYDECYRLSQEEIKKAIPLAAEMKVAISIENVWNNFLLSPLEAARYVDDFKSEWVRFHFDIGNIINYGWPDQWVRVLGSRVSRLHIKDFSRKRRDSEGLWAGFNVELGDGDAGWAATMKALDDIGYTKPNSPHGNWATAEVSGGGLDRLKEISARMDKIFAN